VEELAHEESRVMREAAVDAEDVEKVRTELVQAEKQALATRQLSDAAVRQGTNDPAIYERAGAAGAIAQAKREQLGRYEQKKNLREATARDLRRQIDDLRAQLARYAEALEEDLAQSRERVAARTREGLQFEKAFSEASGLLLSHLRNKPECRDLVNELLTSNTAPNGETPTEQRLSGTDRRFDRQN
jgi:serine/threonine-protein kinase